MQKTFCNAAVAKSTVIWQHLSKIEFMNENGKMDRPTT
jgi:hypothetical protein